MSRYQTTPRRDASKQGALARRLINASTIATNIQNGTLLLTDETAPVIELESGYFLVMSPKFAHRYYTVCSTENGYRTSSNEPRFQSVLISAVEQYITEQYCTAQAA